MKKFTLAFLALTIGLGELAAQLEKGGIIGGISGNMNGTILATDSYFGIGLGLNPYALYVFEKTWLLVSASKTIFATPDSLTPTGNVRF